jgi:hypothetical protein
MSHHDIVFFIAQLSAFSEVNDTSDTCACSCKKIRKSLGLSHKLPDIGGLSSGNFNGLAGAFSRQAGEGRCVSGYLDVEYRQLIPRQAL